MADLLPLESGDSQDCDAVEEDAEMAEMYADTDGDQYVEQIDEEVNGQNEEEEDEVDMNGMLNGAYVVKPEPVDDDISLLVEKGAQQIDEATKFAFASIKSHLEEGRDVAQPDSRLLYASYRSRSEQVMFKCRLCPYTNPYKWKIAQHARTIHMRKTLFKCPHCDFSCERKIEWCVHKTKHSKKVVHACHECAYRTTMKRNFDRHMRRHRNGGPIKCSICTYASTGEAAVQRHMAEFHPSASINGGKKQDDGNGVTSLPQKIKHEYNFKSLYSYNMHGSKSFSSCGEIYTEDNDEDEDSLAIDVRSITDDIPAAHGSSVFDHVGLIYTCRFCQMRFKDLSILKSHVTVKHGEEAANIDLSNWSIKAQESPLDLSKKEDGWGVNPEAQDEPLDLSVQSSSVPQENENSNPAQLGIMKCPHCNYNASWPSDLQRHMMVHSLERRYRCYICARRYKHQFDLNAHLRRVHRVPAGRSASVNLAGNGNILGALLHNKHSLLKKPIASTENKSNSVNDAHSGTGELSGSLKLRCEFCNYVGKYRAEVERHMRLHTGDKPFACLFCSYRSFWKGDMKRHLMKHHPTEVEHCNDLKAMVNDTEKLGMQLGKTENSSKLSAQNLSKTNEDDYVPSKSTQIENKVTENVYEEKTSRFDMSPPLIVSSGTSERQVFKCVQCPFQCDAPSKLKCHAEIHANLKRFKCPVCGKRSNWTWDIRKHIRKDHANINVEVIELSEEEARATLSDYVSTHRTCGRSSSESKESTPIRENFQLLASLAQVDETVDSEIKNSKENEELSDNGIPLRPFKCSECPKRSNWKWDIQKHIRAVHAETGGKVVVFKGEKVPANRASLKHSSSLKRLLKPLSLQPSDMVKVSTERCRPFKCSECGKRSNWKWDLNKHIASTHHSAAYIVTLTEEEARDTFDDYLRMQQKEKSINASITDEEMADFSSNIDSRVANLNSALNFVSSQNAEKDRIFTKTHHSKDAKKLKKFKCSICVYRSNFRSDIQRHLKRRHNRNINATVIELSDKEAAETLMEYRKTFGAKKFTSSPGKLMANLTRNNSNIHSSNINEDYENYYSSGNEESVKSNSYSDEDYSALHDMPNEHETSFDENGASLNNEGSESMIDDSESEPWVKVSVSEAISSKGRGRHFCEWCPYVSINKNDYIYHKQFHRAKPSAPFKCDHCPYWVTQKRLLKQHEKVHQPEYKLRYYPSSKLAEEQLVGSGSDPVATSNVIWSLSQSSDNINENDNTMDYDMPTKLYKMKRGVEVDKSVKIVTNSTLYTCSNCPYSCSSIDRLANHKGKHSSDPLNADNSSLLMCSHCDYCTTNEESLSIHVFVHSCAYQQGVDIGSDSDENASAVNDLGDDEGEEWRCDLCSFHSMKYTLYEKHLLSHRSEYWTGNDSNKVNKSLLKVKSIEDCANILSAVPADIAAAADLSSGLFTADSDIQQENLIYEHRKSSNDSDYQLSRLPIFPGHSFEDSNSDNNFIKYDVNANVAKLHDQAEDEQNISDNMT